MRTLAYGNCRAVGTVEKTDCLFFDRSHRAGKTRQNGAEFPTVPTAPTASLKKSEANQRIADAERKHYGHYQVKGVKNHLVPALLHWPVLK